MSDGYQIVEIVFLAMLAGFVALRLVSVLGRRTGHEGKPVTDVYGGPDVREPDRPVRGAASEVPAVRDVQMPSYASPELKESLQAIARTDAQFAPDSFVSGARAAYRMILEAFWAGDSAALRPLVSDDVLDNFSHAIEARKAAGHTVENRLIDIDSAEIVAAELEGAMAEVTVRFVSQMAAVTRDASGTVIQGSTSDAVEVRDVWTFSRHTRSDDPNWLLIATDFD